jgi:hypothetical protein
VIVAAVMLLAGVAVALVSVAVMLVVLRVVRVAGGERGGQELRLPPAAGRRGFELDGAVGP